MAQAASRLHTLRDTPAWPARLRRAPWLRASRDTPARPARMHRAPRLHTLRDTPARPARLRRAPRLHDPRVHLYSACPTKSCSSVACYSGPRLRVQPTCAVLLGCVLPETTPAQPAYLRRAPRLHVARDHACATCPPAPCSPVACSPRPRSLLGFPIELCTSAACCPRPHLRGQPACVVLLGSMLPETTPARPAHLCRAPWLHVP